jgi:hypothetical protein
MISTPTSLSPLSLSEINHPVHPRVYLPLLDYVSPTAVSLTPRTGPGTRMGYGTCCPQPDSQGLLTPPFPRVLTLPDLSHESGRCVAGLEGGFSQDQSPQASPTSGDQGLTGKVHLPPHDLGTWCVVPGP